MNALLLSAGLGTRFRPITDKIPKPSIPLLNVPLLGYSLYHCEQVGLKNLVINTHHLAKSVEAVTECLTFKKDYRVQFSYEPQILGSGGGIRQAEKLLNTNDDFLVANSDEVIVFSHKNGLAPLIEFHKNNNALATLLTTYHPRAGSHYGAIWSNTSNIITQLGGTSQAPGAQHFVGYFVFSPRIFQYMPPAGTEFHIFKDCLHKAMAAGEKVMSYYDEQLLWLDNSSEKDFIESSKKALELLNTETEQAKNLADILHRFAQNFERMGEGHFLCAGAKFEGVLEAESLLFMGPNSHVRAGSDITGFAVLGANSTFGPGFIDSSVIAPNVHISELVSLRKQLVIMP